MEKSKFLQPRHIGEAKDFRDFDRRRQPSNQYQSSKEPSAWNRVRKGVRILGTTAFIGLTIYNLYVIGGWLSGWYAKRRGEGKRAQWKRNHSREWALEHVGLAESDS